MNDRKKTKGQLINELIEMRQQIAELKGLETQYKRAQEALRKDVEWYRTLYENTPSIYFVLDTEGTILSVNEFGAEQLGYAIEELVGQSVLRVFHTEDQRAVMEQLTACLQKPSEILRWEFRKVRKDTSVLWVKEAVCTAQGADGNTIVLVVCEDITERKRMEEALRESEEWFRAIFEGAAIGIALVDMEGRPVVSNPALQEMLGYSGEELRNMVFTEFTHPDDAMADWELFKELIEGKRDYYQMDKRYYSKDGRLVWGRLTVSLIRRAGGKANLAIGMVEDITNYKHTEEILRDRTKQLQAIMDAIMTFLERRNWREVSALLLRSALSQTTSEYGFIGVVVEGPILRILAHEGIVWDNAVNREFYEQAMRTYREVGYLEFTNFKNLFGKIITTGKSVLSNEPKTDPRSGGLPPGHPPLRHFLGVPILRGTEVVGMIGVANRPGGYTGDEQAKIEILTQAASVLYDSYRRQQREIELETGHKRLEEERENLLNELSTKHDQLQTLSRRLVEVQELERHRIARELHDEIGQLLTGLKLKIESSKSLPVDAAKNSLSEAETLVNELMEHVRELSLNLRPAMLDDMGLLPALMWHFKRYTSQTNVHVEFKHTGLERRRFAAEVETAIYRIVQEALTNVARHASVSQVTVRLWVDHGTLNLQVEDQGVGFDHEAALAKGSTGGVIGIRERAILLGGQLIIQSAPGAGTCLTVELPLGKRPEGGLKKGENDWYSAR